VIKVKTFASPLKIFHVKQQLEELDDRVNQFLAKNDIAQVVSVNDACTTDESGATIGIIRVVAYR